MIPQPTSILDQYIGRLPESIRAAFNPTQVTARNISVPPIANTSELDQEYDRSSGSYYFNPRRIKRAYNNVIQDSEASAAHAAQTAATAYENRNIQRGTGVSGAGDALRAQLAISGRQQTNALVKDKETIISEVRQRQAAQAAAIAAQLASTRQSYTQMIMTANAQNAANQLAADTFNSQSRGTNASALMDAAIKAAQLEEMASSSGGKGTTYARSSRGRPYEEMTPGYLPSFGPLTPMAINGVPQQNTIATGYSR